MAAFDETHDFVVAGSGGGSMCAGLRLRAAGKSVVILEKTALVGGSTARSGGVMWIPNNHLMKRDGVADSFEKAKSYLDGLAANQTDAPGASEVRRDTYLRRAPEMIQFLEGQGIEFDRIDDWPDYYDDRPGGSEHGRTVIAKLFDVNRLGPWKSRLQPTFIVAPVSNMPGPFARLMLALGIPLLPARIDEMMELPAVYRSPSVMLLAIRVILRAFWARLRGRQYIAGGGALQGRMLEAALKAGVDVRTDAPVSELIVEDGRVTGVVTMRDGKPWRIGARLGVLINAGGFARNQRMRDRYIPNTQASWSMAVPGDTGEMIEEMMRIGAATAQMNERVGCQTTIPPGLENSEGKPPAQSVTAAPHVILVDQSGVRYQNEGGSYMAYCKGMLERHQTIPAIPSWAVFDRQYLDTYMLGGTMPGPKPDAWKQQGYLKQADTIDGLAREMAVPPDALTATVARFNGFVDQGRDEDFHRGERAYDRWLGDWLHQPSATLGRIDTPPFYAVPVVPGDVGTYGGVVTDERARVLNENGAPIPGLYATGVSTASVMGRHYPGAGSSVGPSFTWGYVAAGDVLNA